MSNKQIYIPPSKKLKKKIRFHYSLLYTGSTGSRQAAAAAKKKKFRSTSIITTRHKKEKEHDEEQTRGDDEAIDRKEII